LKALKLLHLGNINSTNVGNGALVHGIENTIREDFQIPVEFIREPWDDYTFGFKTFDSHFIQAVNNSDGLIVNGAVTFNGRDYNNITGSRFELSPKYFKNIKKPVIFYGLSYRHWRGQKYHHLDKLSLFIGEVIKNENMLLAVRNDGTKGWLQKVLGIDVSQIREVPDPAMFLSAEKRNDYPEISSNKKNIILSFNDEDSIFRYESDERSSVIENYVNFIEKLSSEFECNFVLCPHYFDDYKMISDVISCVKPQIAHQSMISTGLARVDSTSYFYGRYLNADLAVSMRVHSMSPCIGLGVPMIAYTTQERMVDFINNLELSEYAVDAKLSDSGERLFNLAKSILQDGDMVKKKFQVSVKFQRKQTKIFNSEIFHRYFKGIEK